jgi:secondary thiamine-phosphate synthase enzyme
MYKKILSYDTVKKSEFRSITDDLRDCIREAGVDNGTLMVYSLHTTMGVTIQETSEPNLCQDFIDFLTQLVEDNGHLYAHRCALHPSGACHEDRFNGPSHVRQMLVNQSIVLDIQGSELSLGRWQDVAYIEVDGPRQDRKVFVKIIPD